MEPALMLAIDTATLTASAAVVRVDARGGALALAGDQVETGTHSERLMPLVADVLTSAGVALAELDAIAVGAGPGSFTGLRIGLATAKGLAFAASKPLWLASSLGALAWAMGDAAPGGLRVPVLDARRGELYAGFYRIVAGVPRLVAPERVMPPGDLGSAIAAIRDGGETVTLAGDALAVYADELAVLPAELVRRADIAPTPPAVGVAILAAVGDRVDSLARGAPAYLRPSEAEVKYPDGVPGALRRRH